MLIREIFILFLLIRLVYAQDNLCGTDADQSVLDRIDEYKSSTNSSYKTSKVSELHYIPIQFHIVGDDEGTGYFRKDFLFQSLCELNEKYDSVGFYFYLKGDFNHINNTDYYNHDFSGGYSMMYQYNVPECINIYIVEDPAGNCGYYAPGPDAIAVAKMCSAPGNATWAHEIGHFFGLPHTFSGWEYGEPQDYLKELADGSNCASTADHFCDTRADYLAYRWLCPNAEIYTDPNGDTIDPDETLIMSYSLDQCVTRFSREQQDYMRYDLENFREDLLGGIPDLDSTDTTNLTYPFHESVLEIYDVTFQWNKVPNADQYHLMVSRTVSFSTAIAVDITTTDTFYYAKLEQGKRYYWKVLAYNNDNVCGSYSESKKFTTGYDLDQYNLPLNVLPKEEQNEKISIIPNPASLSQPVRLVFNDIQDLIVLSVYTSEGKLLVQNDIDLFKTNSYHLDIQNYPAGIYFVEVKSKEFSSVRKLVIENK